MHQTVKYVIIIIIGVVLAFNPFKMFASADATSLFAVVGIIYGVIAAFFITAASDRLDNMRRGISEEVNSLIALSIVARRISDKNFFTKKLLPAISFFCKEVIALGSHWDDERVYIALRKLTNAVADAPLKTAKDSSLFDSLESEARVLSSARQMQKLLLESRTSISEWILIVFFSAFLLFLVNAVGLSTVYLATILPSIGTNIAILLIPLVLYKIDFLDINEEKISKKPYELVLDIVNSK